jgi:hypothetical protein
MKIEEMASSTYFLQQHSGWLTNEELEEALKVTQEAILKLGDFCGRMRGLLVAHGTLTELDNKYILGEISEEEYVKRYKEQNSLAYAFNKLFFSDEYFGENPNTTDTDSKEADQDGKSD